MQPPLASNRRKIIILVGLCLLLLILFFTYRLFSGYGKTTTTIVVVPKDAAIVLNGKTGRNGKQHLAPGEYVLSASKDGYQSATKTFVVADTTTEVSLLLTPLGIDALKEAQTNQVDYLKGEGISSDAARREGEEFAKNNPIVERLPYRNLLFSIDYKISSTNKDKIILIVTADSETNRQYARSQIKNWGYEPTSFEIEYTPFGEEVH